MELGISDQDIGRVFSPSIVERFAQDDPRWLKIAAGVRKENRRRRLRRQLLGWMPHFRRTQRGLEKAYSLQWATTSLEEQLKSRLVVPFDWRGEGILAHNPSRKRVHQLLLLRAFEKLQPAEALEVGCGNGVNLFLLGGRFPAVRCAGIELTRGGVEMARQICQLPEIPPVLQEFSVEPLRDLQAHKRLDLRQANAKSLPFPDRSFDLVFTTLALEQMEEIRDEALREIARVAKRHVVMVEPFRDWNAAGWRRDYIIGQNYFSAWIGDLPKFGLRPVLQMGDIPNKLSYAAGLVIAEVM